MSRRVTARVAATCIACVATPAGAWEPPPASAGVGLGMIAADDAHGASRRVALAGGLLGEARLFDPGGVAVGVLAATFHAGDGRSTRTVAVATGYHGLMVAATAGAEVGGLEPYVGAGLTGWLVTTRAEVDASGTSAWGLGAGLCGLFGVRAAVAAGALEPRVQVAVVTRPGRSAVIGTLGIGWRFGGHGSGD